jgi:hypothetical protein
MVWLLFLSTYAMGTHCPQDKVQTPISFKILILWTLSFFLISSFFFHSITISFIYIFSNLLMFFLLSLYFHMLLLLCEKLFFHFFPATSYVFFKTQISHQHPLKSVSKDLPELNAPTYVFPRAHMLTNIMVLIIWYCLLILLPYLSSRF